MGTTSRTRGLAGSTKETSDPSRFLSSVIRRGHCGGTPWENVGFETAAGPTHLTHTHKTKRIQLLAVCSVLPEGGLPGAVGESPANTDTSDPGRPVPHSPAWPAPAAPTAPPGPWSASVACPGSELHGSSSPPPEPSSALPLPVHVWCWTNIFLEKEAQN